MPPALTDPSRMMVVALGASVAAVLLAIAGCGEAKLESDLVHAHASTDDHHEHDHRAREAPCVTTHVAASGTEMPESLDAATMHAMLHDTRVDPRAPCVCDFARSSNGWCRRCGHGFIAGLEINSGSLFEALDAHGHPLGDPASLSCEGCRQAIDLDGFCEACQWGFHDGQMWATPLTWSLTKGRIDHVATEACESCRTNAMHRGWCDPCAIGHVGAFRFASRNSYDRATAQQERLVHSLTTLKRCEECAMRTFFGGICRRCGTDASSLPGGRNPEYATFSDGEVRERGDLDVVATEMIR